MNLERLPEKVIAVTVISLGLAAALAFGHWTGNGEYKIPGFLFSSALLSYLVIRYGLKLWVLIPATWFISAKMNALPLPFSIRELAVLLFFAVYVIFRAFKRTPPKSESTTLDYIMWANIAYLATCYLRNPAGTAAMGSDIVGGKPYFTVIIALVAHWLLAHVQATPGQCFFAVLFTVFNSMAVAFINLIARIAPSTVPVLYQFYDQLDATGFTETDLSLGPVPDADNVNRIWGMRDFSRQAGLALCSYFRPLTLILPVFPWRFLGFMIVVGSVLFSGFRSFFVELGAMFLISTYFRRSTAEAINLASIAVGGMLMLALMQGHILTLPLPVQRALSFLPGAWDYRATQDAAASNEYRFQMWEQALFTDRYIRSKWFGDGFGFTRNEYDWMMAGQLHAITTEEAQEGALLASDYHSGPISTIKFVGVPGFLLFYALTLGLMSLAWKTVRRAQNTPYFSFSLFVGMPLIFFPFFFTLIFGAYQNDLPNAIIGLGMLNLLNRSITDYLAGQKRAGRSKGGGSIHAADFAPPLQPVAAGLAPHGFPSRSVRDGVPKNGRGRFSPQRP